MFLGKLQEFSHLNLAAIKIDDFPQIHHDSNTLIPLGEQGSVAPSSGCELLRNPPDLSETTAVLLMGHRWFIMIDNGYIMLDNGFPIMVT